MPKRMARLEESGFTLIELLVVIALIAVLAGLVAPMVFSNVGDARVVAARADVESVGLALDLYALHNGIYPSTDQGLDALSSPTRIPPFATNWRGPYLKHGVPRDPWGRPYLYRNPGTQNGPYELLSLGRDGLPGGTGEDRDIRSWENRQ